MKKNTWTLISKSALLVTLVVAAGACATTKPSEPEAPKTAKVELKDAKGKSVGTATLTEVPTGVKISLEVQGLKAGEHGLHFHEMGMCEAPKFTTAGNHYNPTAKEHGLKNPKGRHAGDLPNLKVEKSGKATTEMIAEGVTLAMGPTSLLKVGGTALVIHDKADDHKTAPSGNSGDRVACGVVTAQ